MKRFRLRKNCEWEMSSGMRREHRKRIILWGLVLIWMGVIFCFSAGNGDESGDLSRFVIRSVAQIVIPAFNEMPAAQQESTISDLQYGVRKAAHFSVYLVLGVLCTAALSQHPLNDMIRFLAAAGICVLYAVFDEIHQLFVNGRSGQILDVAIDSAGALLGTLAVHIACRRRRRKAALPGGSKS